MTAGEPSGRSLQDQVALVTGSSRGIGAAIATRFAQAGAQVVVHGRDVEALEAVRRQIETDGRRAIAVVADLTDAAQVERMNAAPCRQGRSSRSRRRRGGRRST